MTRKISIKGSRNFLFVFFLTVLLAICLVNGESDRMAKPSEAKYAVYFEHHLAEPGRPLNVQTCGYMLGETLTYCWETDSGELETTGNCYIPNEGDLEQFITVTVSSDFHEDRTARVYCSRLPVLYLNVEDGGIIDSKEEYKKAEMILQGAGDMADYYYEGTVEVKGRGNTSWDEIKKPYKLKLSKKENLLDMGEGKKWVLLANYGNPSLLRNKLWFDLAGEFGVTTSESYWVDLVLNGEYAGNYQLCERIALGAAVDSGNSFLLELDEYFDEEMRFRSIKNQPIMVHDSGVGELDAKTVQTLECFVNAFERAIDAPDFRTIYEDKWVHYTELFDMDSLVGYWVAGELFYNCDFMRKSTWFYIDEQGVGHMGPAWDNDWSCGNPPSEAWDKWTVLEFHYDAQADNWYRSLIKDPVFREKARDVYWEHREEIGSLVEEGGIIDEDDRLLHESAQANDRLWKYEAGYEEDVKVVKNWLINRINWLDQQFATEESLAKSLLSAETAR